MFLKLANYSDTDYGWIDGFDSSHILSILYDHYRFSLVVKFHNGEKYLFAGVPTSVYYQLMAAKSKGKFLNQKVFGHYSSTKIVEEPPQDAQ